MNKSEFRKIQKIVAIAIAQAEKEAISDGVDIRSEDYDKALTVLREKIINELGLTLERYEELRVSFKIPKKPLSYKELVDTPYIPTLPETLKPEAIGALIRENIERIPVQNPQIITKIVKEKVIEKPQIIKTIEKTKEIVKELDKVQLTELRKDIHFLQQAFQDFKIPEYPIQKDWSKEIGDLSWQIGQIKSSRSKDHGYGDAGSFDTSILDSRYIRKGTETDPIWIVDKPNYSTTVQANALYLKLDQTTPQTTVGTFTFPQIKDSGITAGHVVFGGTAGLLSGDAGMFWDNTNKRLGLGTITPTTRFHLAGTTSAHYAQIDTGLNFYNVTRATACTAALIADATGLVTAGDHRYMITFVTALGETSRGLDSNTVTCDAANTKVALTNIPVSADYRVTKRRIYRTIATSPLYHYKLLVEIADNSTTTYTDNTADGSLTGGAIYPGYYYMDNTTNSQFYIDGQKAMFLGTLQNTVVGVLAGNALIPPAYENAFYGNSTGTATTTGVQNTFLGCKVGVQNVTGSNNVYVGGAYYATGSNNTFVGSLCGGSSGNTGSYNTVVGMYSLMGDSTGTWNAIVGSYTGNALTGGAYNTLIGGYYNGSKLTTHNYNVFLGSGAGTYDTVSNTFIVDYTARGSVGASTSSTKALLFGTMGANQTNQSLYINADNVFMGTDSGYGVGALWIGCTPAASPLSNLYVGHYANKTNANGISIFKLATASSATSQGIESSAQNSSADVPASSYIICGVNGGAYNKATAGALYEAVGGSFIANHNPQGVNPTCTCARLYGVDASSKAQMSANTTSVSLCVGMNMEYGIYPSNPYAFGTITAAYGNRVDLDTGSIAGATITDAAGMHTMYPNGAGAITNGYVAYNTEKQTWSGSCSYFTGLNVVDMTTTGAITTLKAINLATMTGGATNWQIYSAGGRYYLNGGMVEGVTAVTDTYNVLNTDRNVTCNKATYFTVTLPIAVVGQVIRIKNIGVGIVTIDGAGSDTIDGELTQTLNQYDGVTLVCNVANSWVAF